MEQELKPKVPQEDEQQPPSDEDQKMVVAGDKVEDQNPVVDDENKEKVDEPVTLAQDEIGDQPPDPQQMKYYDHVLSRHENKGLVYACCFALCCCFCCFETCECIFGILCCCC